ncbi:efflux RND transporter periplasmic adaptor subunit [Parabacteroides bouchesdurhonensis]|uniref:efflux RND transporter periplasmic adaptor subunit n=1 Tax=Parabacteroides bouchesdurhonensis TaxID=1936995 RepID=UPI000E4EC8B5|nr:efflux RND transporter periplasmic adaptor subunit [Parabacteroides bouchesdurhonensis]RHJ93573.1 efflux RND transporter periplasmic adaptor subunit [Bacteroides sp. AM07-16]
MFMMDKRILLFLLCGTILLSGCNHSRELQETYGYRIQGDTVYVIDHNWGRNIKITEAMAVPFSKEVVTAGTVRPIPTQYANIAPPFAGRVVKSYIHMGQKVSQGTPLFEISSPDFTSAQKDYFQALSSRELAQKDLRRKEDLIRNGVSSQKELEEAQNALLIADKDFENAQAALHVYQVENISSMLLGQPLVVRAPISGLIIEDNIVNGQYFKDDSDPIAVVADLSKVWISAQVKEKDIRFIKKGSKLDIEVAALPGTLIKGTVYHIEAAVDEDTRSIRVLSECENNEELLKLGMYTTVHFMSDPMDMVKIPETALLQGEENSYVYVQVAPDAYVRRDVEVETTINGIAIISNGLRAGETIIGEGGYYLK